MKSLFSLIALAALLFTVNVSAQPLNAQYYDSAVVYSGGTNNIPAGASVTNSVFVGRYDNVAIATQFKCTDTNAYPVIITVRPGVSASKCDPNQLLKTLLVTANGTTTISPFATNIATAGFGYWDVVCQNTNPTTAITNFYLEYGKKK